MARATIQQTIGDLRTTLTDYIEATYHIGHPLLVEQRRRLLARAGGTFQEPYLESTPRYVTSEPYESLTDIPAIVRETFAALADGSQQRPLLFNPPYQHQADAVREILTHGRNLMVMTGTGSGKTESFLLPILGKLIIEAKHKPASFKKHTGVRAIVLYPMNALVNDQLGRLRTLFGDPRVMKLFEDWAGRPARFARYTSRTPYAGVRSPKRDSTRLSTIGEFFVDMEIAAARYAADESINVEEDRRAADLLQRLRARGKWPSKESMAGWFGKPGTRWQNKKGEYVRAILGPHDAELLTRHEVHAAPPDLLITNYSMLEYMMLRPIERDIFASTRAWLEACPEEKILVVLDEAHLYRGAQGAEVGLLLRRLRERLNIGPDRFQVICATASFSDEGKKIAEKFGAELTGAPEASFYKVEGKLKLRAPAAAGSEADAQALAAIALDDFYHEDQARQTKAIAPLLAYRGVAATGDVGADLVAALSDFPPFNALVNATMQKALPLAGLGAIVFPGVADSERAIDALLALGSRARKAQGDPSLIPCRVHSFFRGLPGLWACMNPQCSALPEEQRGAPVGKLYAQPVERCSCGAPVLEYFTCRYCGSSYGRAYTNSLAAPQDLWAEPGQRLTTEAGFDEAYSALDLLLQDPIAPDKGEPAYYDLTTGQLNPNGKTALKRIVYLRPKIDGVRQGGEFTPCGCCEQSFYFGASSVQDHQTKGDQPFQALLTTQVQVQPPGPAPASAFAPLRGRKVLIFSDSRQMAARLVQLLQGFSLRDTVRALLPLGFKLLAQDPTLGPKLHLNYAYIAVLVAAHHLSVRLRPALEQGETIPAINAPMGEMPDAIDLIDLISGAAPNDLMKAIAATINHKEFGLEALAIASLSEAPSLSAKVAALPDLPGLAADAGNKALVVGAWLRCWARSPGIWYGTMNSNLWNVEVTPHGLNFDAMNRVVPSGPARKVFTKEWLPRLEQMFVETMPAGGKRLLAARCALKVGGDWRRCRTCRSVHRPIANLANCIDCASAEIESFDPDQDEVFRARRGYYRRPIKEALSDAPPELVALIAAEHTAQLNAAQVDEAFSRAEKHEVRFQDIDLAWRDTDPNDPAVDVLSSTTTMEVGIDIGELSGVALRNMPPARANYQQRAGRAGRRGNAVATVVAFGSSDSHDDHYFTHPDEMISGPVVDPRLTLENADIARRHVRAFLLQRYHEERLPDMDPAADPNLFSVLGRVRDFRDGTGVLNLADFKLWLAENENSLQQALDRWLPHQLGKADRAELIANMAADAVKAIADAIAMEEQDDEAAETADGDDDAAAAEEGADSQEASEEDAAELAESDDEGALFDRNRDKLLDRLLYMGVLPRYAFPTDVAAFYVLNPELSTEYYPRIDYAPSQGLNIALSQYAPNKQIWINTKQYTSKAIYSPYPGERQDAWGKRRLFFECSRCGYAHTRDFDKDLRKEQFDCDACKAVKTFGPGRPWLRPPGFSHPTHLAPASTPDPRGETAYATRAKLVMATPGGADGWKQAGPRIRVYPTRDRLLVSNSGPKDEGYNYCTGCGAIEAAADWSINLFQPHPRPYPSDDEEPLCNKYVERNIVLGTDFRTDICLFSLPVDAPFRLQPGNSETEAALRTVCEALAKAAAQMLQLESGEVLAEFRPALTEAGALGREAEIFFYDTLAGGAGFAPQLAHQTEALIERALAILETCPDPDCDASCYRCLRSFRNRLDHRLFDRPLGAQLLRHARDGGYPSYDLRRIKASLDLLHGELTRQAGDTHTFSRDGASGEAALKGVAVPILAVNKKTGAESWIALASPIAIDEPVDAAVRALSPKLLDRFICVDDLRLRKHLPVTLDTVRARLA